MVCRRTDAAVAFRAGEHKESKVTDAELDNFIATYMTNAEVLVRLPLPSERITTSSANQIAIPVDHFKFGFRFPPLWEYKEILNYYGLVPGQLSPLAIATLFSYLSYLRSEKITFNLKVFRKIFSPRAIPPKAKKPYRGTIYFYCGGIKMLNLPNKAEGWRSRYLMFEGNHGFDLTSPQTRASTIFKAPGKLSSVEEEIVSFLSNSRMDTNFYVARIPEVAAISRADTRLLAPANKPYSPSVFVPTQRERRLAINEERKQNDDPAAPYSSEEEFAFSQFGNSVKDLRGKTMMNWHSKNKNVRISTALPSWKSEKLTPHAFAASGAMYGKRNLKELEAVPLEHLPYYTAQVSANNLVTAHYTAVMLKEKLTEVRNCRKRNKKLSAKIARLEQEAAVSTSARFDH